MCSGVPHNLIKFHRSIFWILELVQCRWCRVFVWSLSVDLQLSDPPHWPNLVNLRGGVTHPIIWDPQKSGVRLPPKKGAPQARPKKSRFWRVFWAETVQKPDFFRACGGLQTPPAAGSKPTIWRHLDMVQIGGSSKPPPWFARILTRRGGGLLSSYLLIEWLIWFFLNTSFWMIPSFAYVCHIFMI